MCRRHPAPLGVAQQHRQTIGHHDGARHPRLFGDAGIGFCAILHLGMQGLHLNTMHLLQKNRAGADALLQLLPVGLHMGRVVTHMVT